MAPFAPHIALLAQRRIEHRPSPTRGMIEVFLTDTLDGEDNSRWVEIPFTLDAIQAWGRA